MACFLLASACSWCSSGPSDSIWALGTLFGITLFTSALKLLQQPNGETA